MALVLIDNYEKNFVHKGKETFSLLLWIIKGVKIPIKSFYPAEETFFISTHCAFLTNYS